MLSAGLDSFVGFDDTNPISSIKCQVGFVFYVWPVILSNPLCSQGLDHCGNREHILSSA
jgi:hypothetical protein